MDTKTVIKRFLQRNSPSITIGIGLAAMVTSTIMAVKAKNKADKILEETGPWPEKDDLQTVVEKSKLLMPVYGPALGMGMVGTGLILYANRVQNLRYTSVATIYTVMANRLKRWEEVVEEELGTGKYEKIRSKVSTPQHEANVPIGILLDESDTLFYDTYSARYFRAPSIQFIRSKITDLNEALYSDDFVSVNDWYFEVKLDPVPWGDDVGWFVENGAIRMQFDSILLQGERPVVTVSFYVDPKHIIK